TSSYSGVNLPKPFLLAYIILCSTLSCSTMRHISFISALNFLLALVYSIVTDKDLLPFTSFSFVDVDCKGYSLHSKSITYILSLLKRRHSSIGIVCKKPINTVTNHFLYIRIGVYGIRMY